MAQRDKIIWIRPDDITRSAAYDFNLYVNDVLPGDWDHRTIDLNQSLNYRSVVQHFRDSVPWEETDFFRDTAPRFERGAKVRGARTVTELKRYYATHVQEVFEDIKENGFLVRNSPHVHIARDGQILFGSRGLQRLAMAKVVGVERIPCHVRTRHVEWQQLRDRIAELGCKQCWTVVDRKFANHPDLTDLLGSDPERSRGVDLYGLADQIPSMGGTRIAPVLRALARDAPANTSIVEVGTWLGAGTAQLVLGIRERQRPGDVSLHCYDRWHANRKEMAKAARWGVRLSLGEDTLPRVRRALEPLDVPIRFHKGDFRRSGWEGGAISVYVDDASKMPDMFFHALQTFGPCWVPGETVIVFMDYEHWKITGVAEHECQKSFIESNSNCFERLEYDGHTVFLYKEPINFDKVSIELLLMEMREREEEIHQLRNSTSWWITAPLRRCADAVRGLVIRRHKVSG